MTHMDQYIIPAGNAAEAAPGVERLDVKAVNRKQDRALYAGREKIYPKLAHGRFRTVKWLVMAVTLGIYYALPWLRWHRGPDLPDQAVLLDMAHNRFFFFFLEIWPQEFYFVTGLLVLARAGAVSRHVGRRARVVRLHLPADGVDRSHDPGRAVLAGRPQRPHAARQGALGAGQALQEGHDAPLLARHRRGYRRRFRLLLPRRADACRRAPRRHGAGHRLSLPRHLHAHDLRAGRHRPRAGLHLHVPLAAHPGRHGRPRDAARELQGVSRRAARGPQEGPALGGARRLHRLQGLRRRVPDRHRHPRRLAARMHPVRAVHRCLQRHHGQGRPAARADRLRHHRQAGSGGQGHEGAAAARARAHAALCRPHLPRRRHHAGGAAQPLDARDQRAARPQPALRAAVRRRHPQRLHGQDPQQAARAARVLPRGARPRRGAARHPRHGGGTPRSA